MERSDEKETPQEPNRSGETGYGNGSMTLPGSEMSALEGLFFLRDVFPVSSPLTAAGAFHSVCGGVCPAKPRAAPHPSSHRVRHILERFIYSRPADFAIAGCEVGRNIGRDSRVLSVLSLRHPACGLGLACLFLELIKSAYYLYPTYPTYGRLRPPISA